MTRKKLVNCSTVTQAVYDAFWPLGMYPDDMDADNLALALRVVADQVVPEVVNPVGDEHDAARADQRWRIRLKILAIAAELESQ
jgi:hypothetical protein